MSENSEKNFLSNHDDNILKALSIACGQETTDFFEKSPVPIVKIKLNFDTKFSINEEDPGSSFDSLKHEPKYLEVCAGVQNINQMMNFYDKKARELEIANVAKLQNFLDEYEEILSEKSLRLKSEHIDVLISHITTIINETNKIKDILQTKALKVGLKVDYSAQNDAIQFFKNSSEILQRIQMQAIDLEREGKKISIVQPKEMLNMQSHIHEFTVELEKNVDNTLRFRETLLKFLHNT